MNEQEFSKIVREHKLEFPDDGFSKHVISHLPQRKSILPQMVMALFVILGLTLMLIFQIFVPVLEQINSLVYSISKMQVPSASAIIIYLGVVGLVGLIGYAMVQADAG